MLHPPFNVRIGYSIHTLHETTQINFHFLTSWVWNLLAHLSRRLTRWAYSIPMVRPSFVHTFKLEYLWNQLASLDQILGRIRLLTFEVACPWMTKILHFRTLISLRPVGQSWSNFMCSNTGGRERLHNVLRQIGSNLWCPWQQKAPIDLYRNGENDVSTISRLFLIWSFWYLQVTRTCIKSRTSSNLDYWLQS